MAKHEGWTNYETWAVNLWLSNDEGTYRLWNRAAKDAIRAWWSGRVTRTVRLQARDSLSKSMQQSLEDGATCQAVPGIYGDLLTHALAMVDWDEIAMSWIESAAEELAEAG